MESHIDYKYGDMSIYKWENPHTYHLKVLSEYVVSLTCVLLLAPNVDAPSHDLIEPNDLIEPKLGHFHKFLLSV